MHFVFDVFLQQFLCGGSLPLGLTAVVRSGARMGDAVLLQQSQLCLGAGSLVGDFLPSGGEASFEEAESFRRNSHQR